VIHVLVVDDEPQLLRALVMNLSGRGYLVSSRSTGRGAIDHLLDGQLDLMILDLGLPDMDGLDVIREVHSRRPALPIVVLSARTGSQEKVQALDLGATDYVTKPFDMNELVARLRASSRRARIVEPVAPVQMGPIVIDLGARIVRHTEPPFDDLDTVHLTPTEWRMVEVLLRRPGALTSATELLTAMRGSAEHTERSYLRIYMQQLRRKLEVDPARPRFLITEPGLGYRFVP
jgi:two-component system KDP operon response regulator KdpE